MEDGWDDSSVIKTPRERKWRRITAEIEQRTPSSGKSGDFRILGLRGSSMKGCWSNGNKMKNRKNLACDRNSKQDILEWEEILEIALAKKIGRRKGKRRRTGGEDVVDDQRRDVEIGKRGAECMKRLEVLLQNRIPPQTFEVCHYRHAFGNQSS